MNVIRRLIISRFLSTPAPSLEVIIMPAGACEAAFDKAQKVCKRLDNMGRDVLWSIGSSLPRIIFPLVPDNRL